MPKLIRNRIKKKLLIGLYQNQKLNLKEVGKYIGFSARTVNILMHEYKIPLRSSGNIGPKINKGILRELYLKKGLSSRKIAKIYKCSYSYIDKKIRQFDFPVKTLAAAHIITKREPFSKNLAEKAYLIGFKIGDLRARKIHKNSETILIDCGSTKINQILLIKRLFENYGRIWISKPTKAGKTQIEAGLNLSFSFLLPNFEKFPLWATKNKAIFLNILAGFIDAEGCFYICKRDKSAGFSLGNYNKIILKQIDNKLQKLHFKTRLFMGVKKGYRDKDGYCHKQDYWILNIIRKADLYTFTKIIIPFLKHKDRVKDAKKVMKNIEDRNKKFGFKGIGMLNFRHVQ